MPIPDDPYSFDIRRAHINSIQTEYVDQNEEGDQTILLLHGWPEIWLGWRHQIPFLARLGFRVVAPSLRGMGDKDPRDYKKYSADIISDDLNSLLDHLDIKKPVVVMGHDWGGFYAWRFAQFYPNRVKAIASFCTPYSAPSTFPKTFDELNARFPAFYYQRHLIAPEGEKDINSNLESFFKRVFCPIGEMTPDHFIDYNTMRFVEGRPDVPRSQALPAKILDYYVKHFQAIGIGNSLHWYKQTENNHEQCKGLNDYIMVPALMVSAECDPILTPDMTVSMDKYVPGLEMRSVKDAGHWILWEKPAECNSILKDWLKGLMHNACQVFDDKPNL
ncbi:Alpha/Beta hydrolase protein [Syncephalastrum racemosum]|uniref:Alpha/Beta hydrolase protein n=1 Tax=Syncephalastrum racemosum TaxID=13706 RepID=A0A1X2H3V1_SYNRA|nr:Alpha/Beta hydrolase protein [Syncephalastrum racemosum]